MNSLQSYYGYFSPKSILFSKLSLFYLGLILIPNSYFFLSLGLGKTSFIYTFCIRDFFLLLNWRLNRFLGTTLGLPLSSKLINLISYWSERDFFHFGDFWLKRLQFSLKFWSSSWFLRLLSFYLKIVISDKLSLISVGIDLQGLLLKLV